MSWLVGTSITLHKEIISIEHNMVKIPTGRRQSSRLFTSEAEEAIEKQLQLAARAGLEPRTIGFQVRRPGSEENLHVDIRAYRVDG